ncbi:hypothetical protein [Schlesneria sp. T3-172]|uniref:hypothetical protein n=1 Tax=Schlesneria sphaerica TaxID=3373610 RepID=UPI0037CC06FD
MGHSPAEPPQGLLATVGQFIARFCTSAWVGAATLFVIVGVAEVTRGGFDSATKDILVALRFPAYYVCGVVLMGSAWLGALIGGPSATFPRFRRTGALIFLALSLGVLALDYVFVYLPLLRMVVPPGQAKSASFTHYHEASKWVNLVGLTLCLIATVLIQWPVRVTQVAETRTPDTAA